MNEVDYWNAFYREARPDIQPPSTFACFCRPKLPSGSLLFELGCGNGRDALFFAESQLRVIACDRSDVAIKTLSSRPDLSRYLHKPHFVVADMSSLTDEFKGTLDVVYSRFTLHAVTKTEAARALSWAHDNLRPGGQLMIEARSVKGSLYGLGEQVEPDAFLYDGHYRRFLRLDELVHELSELGFAIDETIEAAGLALYKDDDPVVIRCRATKRPSAHT